MTLNPPPSAPKRRYEKGERRFKHVGTTSQPEIVFDDSAPRKWVGKCPNTINQSEREKLLNAAIAGSNGDRDIPFPKKLYAVRDGAIYEAQTSDHGHSYHAYPYRGRLAQRLIGALARMADERGCREAFDRWVRMHIEPHGT